MLSFSGYNKFYNGSTVISIPQLTLEAGIYWLKGENGSGKTTLIKSIAGLIPFSGSICVDGIDIARQRTQYRAVVNYAEAEPVYPVFLTGSDLIAFYAKTKRAPATQAAELAAALGIDGFKDNNTGTYSSGMAKKLSLVLGFTGQPRLVMLDEPLVTLDTQAVARLQALIAAYYAAGTSFLITSHQEIAIPGAEPVRLLVSNGTLEKAGS